MTAKTIHYEFALVEAAHIRSLVTQFRDLVAGDAHDDPAVLRLVPDAYSDDAAAATEFRRLTERELLDRRTEEADTVLAALEAAAVPAEPGTISESDATLPVTIAIVRTDLDNWLRTFAALRLVLASRLGITSADDHDEEDPRFAIYDWLGYRLEFLIASADATA